MGLPGEASRVLTLWMFRYHTGTEPKLTNASPMFFEFFYAEDREAARKRIEELKPKIKTSLVAGQWSGEIWEDLLEPAPNGFNTGQRYLKGKIEVDAEGKEIPKPQLQRYR